MKYLTSNYIILIAVVLVVAFVLSRIVKHLLKRYLNHSLKVLNVDITNYNFLKNASDYIIFSIAVFFMFYFIPELNKLGYGLLAGAGIVAAVVGFASQQAFSNIISGIFIVIFKPFRVGDIVAIQQNNGIVEDITLRHTVIRNFENRRVVIPNSIISNETILNSTIADPNILNFYEVGVSYESDIDKASWIIREEAEKHANTIDKRSEEDIEKGKHIVEIKVINLAESSVILRAYIWTKTSGEGFALKCDLNKILLQRFRNEGIEIPYPQRTISYKK